MASPSPLAEDDQQRFMGQKNRDATNDPKQLNYGRRAERQRRDQRKSDSRVRAMLPRQERTARRRAMGSRRRTSVIAEAAR
jgi:hypothetical protein